MNTSFALVDQAGNLTHDALIAGMFALAREGRTPAEMTAAALELTTTYTRPELTRLATGLHGIHRHNTENAERVRAILASVLDDYPATSYLTPVIVNAAPFADRPSYWTHVDDDLALAAEAR